MDHLKYRGFMIALGLLAKGGGGRIRCSGSGDVVILQPAETGVHCRALALATREVFADLCDSGCLSELVAKPGVYVITEHGKKLARELNADIVALLAKESAGQTMLECGGRAWPPESEDPPEPDPDFR